MTVDAGQKDIGRFFEAKNTHTHFANKSKKQSQHTFSVRTGANAFAFPKMVGPVTTKLVYFANLPGSLVQALHSPTLHIFSNFLYLTAGIFGIPGSNPGIPGSPMPGKAGTPGSFGMVGSMPGRPSPGRVAAAGLGAVAAGSLGMGNTMPGGGG